MRKAKTFIVLAITSILLYNCSDDEESKTPPEVRNLQLVYSESLQSKEGEMYLGINYIITADYEYYDAEGDVEGNTQFNWYRSDDQTGTNRELVSGISGSTYEVTTADIDKYISVEVIPIQADLIEGEMILSDYSPLVVDFKFWDGESITRYEVVGNEIFKTIDYPIIEDYLPYQQDTNAHKEIWEQVLKIVPEEYLMRIKEFVIFKPEDNTAGYVRYYNKERSVFILGISIDLYEQAELHSISLEHVIAHELGHIMTLNETQGAPTGEGEESCSTYYHRFCYYDDSYVYDFYKEYWVSILEEYNTFSDPYEYYDLHPDQFVRWYAATSVTEDIADSFAYYVLYSDQYNTSTIAGQKVLGLDKYSEFKKVKEFANTNLVLRNSRSIRSKDIIQNMKFKCGTELD